MRTEDWIRTIAADQPMRSPPVARQTVLALVPALLLALALFLLVLGPRPDFEAATATFRFALKFVLTALLAGTALALAIRLGEPGAASRGRKLALLAAPALLLLAVLAELALVPEPQWTARLVGRNWLVCLIAIPALSVAPLAALLLALRSGASMSPARSGAVAGLAAGALGATLYAAHCPDDSPLFLAVWYVTAILFVAGIGALLGSRLLKW